MQIWNAKYAVFFSGTILNIEIYCADILHEIDGNFKEVNLIRHRKIKITFTKVYRCFDFVTMVNKNITALCVWHPVIW